MRAGAAVVLIGALLLAGCSAEATEPTSSADAEFTSRVASAISRAESAGASETQLAILHEAQQAGALEFEPYRQAVQTTLKCIADAGLKYETSGPSTASGLPLITYGFEAPDSGPDIGSECVEINSRYVEELYQNQPAADEAVEQAFLDAMPQLIPCLREDGWLPPTGSPSADEVKRAIEDGMTAAEDGDAPMESNPMKCVIAAGLTDGFTPNG